MNETIEAKVWLIINQNGEYIVGEDYDEVGERWASPNNGFCNSLPQRCVCVTVRLPKPVEVEAVVEIPAEPNDGVKVTVS